MYSEGESGRCTLSSNPVLMYSFNVKYSENADRWLAALSSSIAH